MYYSTKICVIACSKPTEKPYIAYSMDGRFPDPNSNDPYFSHNLRNIKVWSDAIIQSVESVIYQHNYSLHCYYTCSTVANTHRLIYKFKPCFGHVSVAFRDIVLLCIYIIAEHCSPIDPLDYLSTSYQQIQLQFPIFISVFIIKIL